jgi:predicted lyase
LRHLAFKVENIDEYVAYLLENSIDCEPIRVDELTGMKYTFFRDPDYLPIELYENNY